MAIWGKKPPVIDVHVHTSFNKQSWKELSQANGVHFNADGLIEECKKSNITHFAAVYDMLDENTPIISPELSPQLEAKMLRVGVVNPEFAKADALKKTEKLISEKKIHALKIYSGRYPLYCSDKKFTPFYKLAGKYEIPVYIHTGDTVGENSRLKYAHPLYTDDVAVDFPGTNFILTQLGNPWMDTAVEVAYKNDNVYLDTAGLFVGMLYSPLYQAKIKYVLDMLENPRKLIYGSDWPISSMHNYLAILKKLIPVGMHERVFYKNAKELFNI